MSSAPAASNRRREVLFVISTVMVIVLMGMSIMVPVLPLYAQSFGVTSAMVGMVVASFGLARIFMDLPSGHWSERFGRRPFLIAGPAVFAVASLLCGLASDFWLLILFRFIQGLGSALYTTAAMTVLIDISTKEDRGRTFSLYQGTLLLGTGIGPTFGGLVAQGYGLRAPFYFSAFLGVVATLWAFWRIPETRPAKRHETPGTGEHPPVEVPGGGNLRSLLLNVNFLLVGLVGFGLHFTHTGSRQTIAPLLGYNVLGLSEAQIGFAMTLISLVDFAVLFFGGALSDRFGRKVVIVPAFVVMAAGVVLFALGDSYALFLGASAIYGVGRGIGGAAPMAFASDISREGSHGVASGLYRTFCDAGLMIGPVVLGFVADSAGYAWALYSNAALILLITLLFGIMAREPAREPASKAALAEADG